MKIAPITLILFVVLLLAACTPASQPAAETAPAENTGMEDMDMNHMGCQEGEVREDGTCIPAEENNRALFGQDFAGRVQTEELTGDLKGFYAEPVEQGNYPGVVMIHEWWGLNDNIKEMAQILAAEGYRVFAVDLYDGQVATESSQAGQLAGSVRNNPDQAIATMQAATAYLEDQGATQIGSMGWCFGGQQSLQLSLNEDIDATVIYYGQLTDNTTELQNINGPVLGIFGADDGSIPVSSVESFESSLNTIGIENNINIYDGVGHAFANPSGSNYAPDETIDAWEKTVAFLNENLN